MFTECANVSGGCTLLNAGAFFEGTWNDSFGVQEPNNSGYSPSTPGSGEHYLEINYSANPGTWNDISNTNSVAGYVVEFGDEPNGASSYTGQSTATTTVTTAHGPRAPGNVAVAAATAAGGQATVSRSAPGDDGGSPITGYLVTAIGSNGAPSHTCATTTAITCTIIGLTDGALYTFNVAATNAIGATASSPTSQLVEATAPTTAPTTPPSPITPVTVTGPACPAASGSLAGPRLGPVAIGLTSAQLHRTLPTYTLTNNGFDRWCLAGGVGKIRVGYPSPRLLAIFNASQRARLRGRVVLALTANPHYALDHIAPGARVAPLRRQLARIPRFQIGRNTWYVTRSAQVCGVLKVQAGTVQEIGIADPALTTTPAAQRRLLTSF